MKTSRILICLVFLMTAFYEGAHAIPTSVLWTVCTTDVQETGTVNLGVLNYFTVFNKRGHGEWFNPDVEAEFGVCTWEGLSMEAGIDYFGGADDPLYFNAKVGVKEDVLFCHAPSFSVGIFNVGTRTHGHNRTNDDVVDFIVGKSLPEGLCIGGRVFAGFYSGGSAIGRVRRGFMVAYTRDFCPTCYCDGKEYYKWSLVGDYASGRNLLGGGGVGVVYRFTPDINVVTGPVWFNDAHINGRWKWTVQVNATIPVFDPCSCCWAFN